MSETGKKKPEYSEHALRIAVSEGQIVKYFLADPVIAGMLTKLDADYIKAWKIAKTPEERELIHAEIKGLERFCAKMKSKIVSADVAKEQLESKSP